MNDLIENHVQKKNVVVPPVMVGSSPKWLTQQGPLICVEWKQQKAARRYNYGLILYLAPLRLIENFYSD